MTTGRQCAEAAERAVTQSPPITYQQEDCQAFIEQTVKRAGGSVPDYRGSNDMYRNACTRIVPLKGAALEPGMVLFIVAQDGREPERYKADGLGNASHVGWYTGLRHEVVHSSASRGQVAASTLKNAWTHAGWLKGIAYNQSEVTPMKTAVVHAESGDTVRMRKFPTTEDIALANVPVGTTVGVLDQQGEWWRITHGGLTGWMMSKFLTAPVDDPPAPIDRMALLTELEGLNKREAVIIAALKGVG